VKEGWSWEKVEREPLHFYLQRGIECGPLEEEFGLKGRVGRVWLRRVEVVIIVGFVGCGFFVCVCGERGKK